MGKSRSIKNALLQLLKDIQYEGEPAFANVTDDTSTDFEEYPVLRLLPDFIENEKGAMSQNDRTVNLQAVVMLPLEDPAHIQAQVIDQIYDLTDLVLDALDQGDFRSRLEQIDPTIGTFILSATMANWEPVDTKAGAQIMMVINISAEYSLDLEY